MGVLVEGGSGVGVAGGLVGASEASEASEGGIVATGAASDGCSAIAAGGWVTRMSPEGADAQA